MCCTNRSPIGGVHGSTCAAATGRCQVSERCQLWIGTSKRTGVPPTQDSTAPTGILPPSDACRRWAVSKQTALALPALLAEALNQLSVGVDDVTADLQTFAETLHQGLPA